MLSFALLFLSGLLAGMVNAIAGGGTFITFAALVFVGLSPISANATSSIAQFPGYVTSTLAYSSTIKDMRRSAVLLAVISALGALGGAFLLLSLDNQSFRSIVPWLLLGATLLFAVGPSMKHNAPSFAVANEGKGLVGSIVQFLASIYGGFFGAGMGILMLATLSLTQWGDYHRLNALKNLLSVVIAVVAIIVFTSGGLIAWLEALVMVPAVAVGGYVGVWSAKRVSPIAVRVLVICIGLSLTIYYFLGG